MSDKSQIFKCATCHGDLPKQNASGFCDKHQPNPSLQYAGCWVCSRIEESALIKEMLEAFGLIKDQEAGWVIPGEERAGMDTSEAVGWAIQDYNALRQAYKRARGLQ